MARQRDTDGKGVQQVRVTMVRDGSMLTVARNVMGKWKEYFEEPVNEENERVEEGLVMDLEVANISKAEVRRTLKNKKSGKAVGPDDIPVEVWKCRGKVEVKFWTRLFNKILAIDRIPEEWKMSVLVL